MWPSKIGKRRGDVIKDARLQNPSRCGHCLIAALVYHSAGNMMSGRDTLIRLQLPASSLRSYRLTKWRPKSQPEKDLLPSFTNNRSLMTVYAREEPRHAQRYPFP